MLHSRGRVGMWFGSKGSPTELVGVVLAHIDIDEQQFHRNIADHGEVDARVNLRDLRTFAEGCARR